MLHDPLVGAVCNPEEVWQMVDEMLVAQATWLPQYAGAIEGAKQRLAAGRVPTRATAGAARRGGAQHRRAARHRRRTPGSKVTVAA